MWASAKRESFIREMLCFIIFAKVFTRESFRLYGTYELYFQILHPSKGDKHIDKIRMNRADLTLSPFLSLEPLGAVGGPGKESQSRRWQTS